MIDDLYSAKILGLAANLPHAGRLEAPDASSTKVSKLCGSTITVDLTVRDGVVADFAQDVRACALGQAAAAVLGEHVLGATPQEIEVARDALRAMLKADGPPPEGRFSELSVLAPVKDYPARHTSTLLAFEAAAEAARTAVDSHASRTSRAGAA
ncbi:iron-sulfur cluster assembly scaffold protein [Phenylobacterium montanum]|uniref:Iron-sulfur cluster assembly scaffold protein n=1 Tax=Phenylobacterium montanum TaxID=2823693 RepID=A0A975ITD6_9CAUL|nr:iron-sulfur cluster assembly scaffold protein [Caulobacter sp. S6]QUD86354.1 iron-sulfur cluster assembly scaffold protein [Caulobacter sp. S6]